ncbi:MAG: hypothetical protein RIT14_1307 [Pseudomonadota bacterium]|jgi:putative photosynthetic complex assembly protein
MSTRQPAFRAQAEEMIPRALLRAMAGLALAALAIATYASVTGTPPVGQPQPAAVVQEKLIVLEGRSAQSVLVTDPDGTVLADLPHGGFITVIQNALARERLVDRIDGNPPIRIVRYANGRLAAEDPATGWSAELYAFGSDNKAAFERLLEQ